MLIVAIEMCEGDGFDHRLRAVFDAYKKTCKMAEEAGVDLSLYGVKLTDVDTFTGLRWFIEGDYIWDMIKKLNKAKYDQVSDLPRLTEWSELDSHQKLQFTQGRNYIIDRLKEKVTYDRFRNY
ncbi:hypothetical protein [Pseudomonas phage PA1C]|nr:hypothetical protein [Pseudomonas phage PA1C]